MKRTVMRVGLTLFALALFGLVTLDWPRAVAGDKEKAAAPGAHTLTPVEVLRKLNAPITLEKGMEKNTYLKDAVGMFSDHFTVMILIDTEAFKEMRTAESDEVGEIETVKVGLPPIMAHVPLKTALRLLLSKVGGTYLIRDGFIEVTTPARATPERIHQEKVAASFDGEPLADALRELSDSTGATIVIDPRLREKSRTPVTAAFKNDVTLSAAVRLLADMTGTKVVLVGGTLYVTTPENAGILQKEEENRANSISAKRTHKKEVEKKPDSGRQKK